MDNQKPKSDLRKNLEYRCRDCEWCAGQGLKTIFHDRYTGLPYIELKRHSDGQVKKYALRCAVPCVCILGQWIREQHEQEATAVRQPRLEDVIEGRIPWTIFDPSLPPDKPADPKTWAEFRQKLASTGSNGVLKLVKPEYEGNSNQARRSMGETTVEGR